MRGRTRDIKFSDILDKVAENRDLDRDYVGVVWSDFAKGLKKEIKNDGVHAVRLSGLGHIYKSKAKLIDCIINPDGVSKQQREEDKRRSMAELEAIRYFEDQKNYKRSSVFWGHNITQLDFRYRKFLTKEEKDSVRNAYRGGSRHDSKTYKLIQEIQNEIYEQQ